MAYTKILKRNGKFVLQVKQHKDGLYKQIFSSERKSEVNRKRAEVQAESVDVKAAVEKRTFVDTYEEFYKYKISIAEKSYTAVRLYSVKCYKQWFGKYIKPFFDSRILLSEVTAGKHAKEFFLKLRASGATWKSANNVVKSFLTCLKFAVNNQYITRYDGAFHTWKASQDAETADPNPAEMQSKKTKMISLQQCQRLFQYLIPKGEDIRDWQRFAVVATLMFAGVRLSELRGLKWDAINSTTGEIKIFRTVVNNGRALEQVKKMGSLRDIIMHPVLREILTRYKTLLNSYFDNNKQPYVFPSLRNNGSYSPLSDRTITDWLKLAFADLGFAKVKVHYQENNKKHFVQLLECDFDHSVTRTFRHFYCTAIKNSQKKYPDVLTDNFSKSQSGHRDYKTFANIYGDHDNFDGSDNMKSKQIAAIKGAIPIGFTKN